eukprot:GDKJ01013162.1.p1 GENE.GDKJ01013162.1~~GDKJ01013162.1.p1  ORF type:complete len:725 (+),score=175.79 GDKJ01013162.1:87-2261(+)
MTGSNFFSFNGGFNFSSFFKRNSIKSAKDKSPRSEHPETSLKKKSSSGDQKSPIVAPIKPLVAPKNDSRTVHMRVPTHETLIIFDWDDTLFPTSWVIATFRNSKDTARIAQMLNKEQQAKMKLLERRNLDLLRTAKSFGEVRIVTHASTLWVKESCESLMPNLYSYMVNEGMMDIHLIACFDRYLYLTNKPYPKHMWKKIAFATFAKRLYENVSSSHPRSVISIGDGAAEYQAAHYLKDALIKHKTPATCKIMKFVEDNPKLEALIKQVGYTTELLESLCDLTVSVDVHLHFDKNNMIKRRDIFPNNPSELKHTIEKFYSKKQVQCDENGCYFASSINSHLNKSNPSSSHYNRQSSSPSSDLVNGYPSTQISSAIASIEFDPSRQSATEVAANVFSIKAFVDAPQRPLPNINALIKHQLPSEQEEAEGLRLMGMNSYGEMIGVNYQSPLNKSRNHEESDNDSPAASPVHRRQSPNRKQKHRVCKDADEVLESSNAIDSFHLERARQMANVAATPSSNEGVKQRRDSSPSLISNPHPTDQSVSLNVAMASASAGRSSPSRRASLPSSSNLLESVVTLNKLDRFEHSNNTSHTTPQPSISLPSMPLVCPPSFPPPLAQRARQSIIKAGGGFSSSSTSIASISTAVPSLPSSQNSSNTSIPKIGPGALVINSSFNANHFAPPLNNSNNNIMNKQPAVSSSSFASSLQQQSGSRLSPLPSHSAGRDYI